jgi:hypothetical protein
MFLIIKTAEPELNEEISVLRQHICMHIVYFQLVILQDWSCIAIENATVWQ